MQLNIKNEDAYALASELSRLSGESMTQAVVTALRERLYKLKEKRKSKRLGLREELKLLGLECSALPTLDERSPDEILYDNLGLPR